MIAKSKSATIFKVVLAFAMLVPCAFLFAACNSGDPIEQAEALTALSTAENAETYADVNSFTVSMSLTQQTNEDGTTTNMSQTSRTIVYKTDTGTIIEASSSMEMTMRKSGAVEVTSSADGSLNYKLVKIGDNYYKVNEENKVYDDSNLLEMESSSNILMLIAGLPFIDQDEINSAGEGNVEADLRTTGENSYNLRFIVTETQTMNEGADDEYVAKAITEYYYEIRDSKLTKFEYSETEYEDDAQISKTRGSYSIEYSARTLTAPTSLDGYTQEDLSLSGILG